MFARIGISTNPTKRYTSGKEEGRMIKGGDSQQKRGFREKSEKKNKKKKNRW